jgi:hypothetical protein
LFVQSVASKAVILPNEDVFAAHGEE